ncbi:cytoplasmic dynein 2 intermediate chain 2 [Petromyzon marinus]|uniref:WD repeat-containing protein 34 n=1 Tax=Petromyzon marinus TaxID=7757 RepID=A0AAJ7U2X1_PETMA|nr:WD repeat-containing protein 34 [Petromyzon marinus]
MFSDASNEAAASCTSSSWQRQRQGPRARADAAAQSEPPQSRDAASQARRCVTRGSQTAASPEAGSRRHGRGATGADDDEGGLLAFLLAVEPVLSEQLRMNATSQAFDGHEVAWTERGEEISCLHELSCAEAKTRGLAATAVGWSCTGAMIGVAFGRLNDGDWTVENSMICLWNVCRRGLIPDMPDRTLDVPGCLLCLSFHPTWPAVIAGGASSGEVFVWDTSQEEDPLLAHSGVNATTHQQPVTQVQWVHSPGQSRVLLLMSAGLDGCVMTWRVELSTRKITPNNRVVLLAKHLPSTSTLSKVQSELPLGITAFSLSEDSSMCVAGLEGGQVVRCLLEPLEQPTRKDQPPLNRKSPALFPFVKHQGPVYAVNFSPFNRNAFLSGGIDGQVRVFSALLHDPVLVVRAATSYVLAAAWSPARPLVLAASTAEGELLLFDLAIKDSGPVHCIQASPSLSPVSCLAFNPKQPGLLAVGLQSGAARVWTLPSELIVPGVHETDRLKQLVSATSD